MNTNLALNYPSTESSIIFAGTCAYEIINDQVIITIGEIANNRDDGNISGTLAVELWALPQPYFGDNFNGIALAGHELGELYDQYFWADCRYEMPFQEPSEGEWHLVLMLREWTDAGYITRDYCNFAVPYIVNNKPTIVRHEESNVINVSFNDKKKPATGKLAKKTKTPKVSTVSLNQATLEEIEALKGVSKKVAENIVLERPFESLDEVLKVKGIGARLLERIRQFITL